MNDGFCGAAEKRPSIIEDSLPAPLLPDGVKPVSFGPTLLEDEDFIPSLGRRRGPGRALGAREHHSFEQAAGDDGLTAALPLPSHITLSLHLAARSHQAP